MTPQDIIRVILGNIEDTKRRLEDGPVGYVLIFDDRMNVICESKGMIRKDHPLNDDMAVLTSHERAATMRRYWNHENPDDQVKIMLRREAMVAYIDAQQRSIEIISSLNDLAKGQAENLSNLAKGANDERSN